jgi:hypothetical protein
MATRMLAEAEEAEEAVAARAEKVAARRAALGERVLELDRFSVVEAKATTAKVPDAASALQNRPKKVLKREPIQALLPEGRGVVSEPRTAEERRRLRLAREARRALEQIREALEMAENKAEHWR